MPGVVVGIDTGGTYTDGVLLDHDTREVLASIKTLTTHQDLRQCILSALDAILPEDREAVQLVSISTTLATNAIAEGKGRPVALFLLGYDPELVQRFNLSANFATSHYEYVRGGHRLNGEENAPLDLERLRKLVQSYQAKVEAFAVSGYFSPFNAEHELRAGELIEDLVQHPIVLGHQLSTRLNSIQRAATATLNATLLSILQDFIRSMQHALDERGVRAPLMIMRGDGALMNAAAASRKPVETVHSGPAASAIGARFLAGIDRALVIDIGGTTTDLAIVDGGKVRVSESGTSVGPYNTSIRAAEVRSIGLGGDSLLEIDVEGRLSIGPARVVPLAYLADRDPFVAQSVRSLSQAGGKRPSTDFLQYWFLNRDPAGGLDDPRAMKVIEMLRKHPLPLPTILERLELLHPIQLGGERLIKEEIIGRAGLTPTDLLHVSGEYAPWDAQAARSAAGFFARLLNSSIDDLDRRVKLGVRDRIVEETVAFLSGHTIERGLEYVGPRSLGAWLFDENLNPADPYLGSSIYLKIPIIGIGAPAGIYLPAVAEVLKTELVLPPNFSVANAIGAVAGSVTATEEAWILPAMHGMHLVGYTVRLGQDQQRFPRLESAMDYARSQLGEAATEAARRAGAGEIELDFEVVEEGAENYRLRARAAGNPKLGSER
jgi:N-methylhydantoinase A/oxoprolinase/acetone carboxylase beta subunit